METPGVLCSALGSTDNSHHAKQTTVSPKMKTYSLLHSEAPDVWVQPRFSSDLLLPPALLSLPLPP